MEINQWTRHASNTQADVEFAQKDITLQVQLNINLNEHTTSEHGEKVLSHLTDSKETTYLSSEYFNRHWIYDFLPWEPDAATYTSVLKTGGEQIVMLTDDSKLAVTMTETSLNKMHQFVTESLNVIESPDTRTFSTNARISLPTDDEGSCRTTIVSAKNMERKTEFCVIKV